MLRKRQRILSVRIDLMEKMCLYFSGASYFYFRTIEDKVWFARYCIKVDVSKTWVMYGRSVLSGWEWLNLVMKGTFDLCCTARAKLRRGEIQNEAGS